MRLLFNPFAYFLAALFAVNAYLHFHDIAFWPWANAAGWAFVAALQEGDIRKLKKGMPTDG